jgi:hypothetical protein
LAKEKEILAAKYETEVDELRTSQDAEIEKRNTEIRELAVLRKFDCDRYVAELVLWRARDRKIHAGLQGLEHALHGVFPLPLLHFCSFTPFPLLLFALADAFPNSAKDVAVMVEKCRAEYHIVCHENPKVELSSEELMASIKGQLQPAAELGSKLCQTVASVFRALWPGRAEPDDAEQLLRCMLLVSNRVDVWKESAARAGAKQALSFVLSWYQGVNLDQLEHLCEGGLSSVDRVKLRQRVCAIAECANTNELFDAGEGDGDKSLDDADFEEPSFAEASEKATEDPADSSVPPSPSGEDFVLAARIADDAPFEPADTPAAP